MRMLKFVVVGPGLMGKQHIRLIHENPDCALHSIVAPDHPANHETAQEAGAPIFHTLRESLERGDVDGVIISSPNPFHAEQARICIEAGITVLIEKPITVSVADAEAIARLADEKGVHVLVGHHRAHSPLLGLARETIQQGRLGRIVTVMGSAQFYKPPDYFEAGPWRQEVGGGPILINLIHEIGNLRSLCGEITAVQALSSSAMRGFPVEDTVAINLMFENGALGTFMLSDTASTAKSWEQTSRENPIYPTYPDEDCYTITGTLGSLSIPTMRMKYYDESTPASWLNPFSEEQLEVHRYDPLTCQLEHFIKLVRGQCEPLVSAADGLRNLKVTEAIRTSAAMQRIVHL
ncbi:Gfo/Idh/MocA family protein [Oleiagrimonas soli]|uniref:Oxidoreductase n=1 Tax=Oleiagrimonas soli TaxID=1543381 RepID=A0A099CU75_9GAMM|nr:Gfo/Idh/MocA family oxidoreductase [Oleiagrimonas soli]KGI77246.1 oxidoreductase [Oleiagrimonas soli]MBB6185565.1 putative dehydrogenase [Oleiagrimonas soli]